VHFRRFPLERFFQAHQFFRDSRLAGVYGKLDLVVVFPGIAGGKEVLLVDVQYLCFKSD